MGPEHESGQDGIAVSPQQLSSDSVTVKMALSQSRSSEHGKMHREECAGETPSALMVLRRLLCVLS